MASYYDIIYEFICCLSAISFCYSLFALSKFIFSIFSYLIKIASRLILGILFRVKDFLGIGSCYARPDRVGTGF